MGRKIIIILLAVLIVDIIAAIVMLYRRKKKNEDVLLHDKGKRLQETQYNFLIFLQRFYANVPIISRYYRRIRHKVQILYPADSFSIARKTSEILSTGTIGAVAGIAVTLLFAKGDIFFIMAGLTVTYLIMSSIVNSGINRLNYKLLEEFQLAIDYIQTQYQNHHMLPRALKAAAEDMPQLIGLHMQKIYDIITGPDSKLNERVDAYVGNEPNRYMLIFLSICASIETYGDKKLKDGSWRFVHDMECLRDGVDAEILSLDKTRSAFMTQEMICILPVIFIKPLESYMAKYFDGTSGYYNGIAGLVSMIAIFVTALISHNLIVMLRDGNEEVDKENDVWSKVASISFIEPFLERVIEKNYTKYARYDDAQKGIGNRTGPMALLAKQVVFGAGAFILVMVLFMSASVRTRIEQAKNWKTAFEESTTADPDYIKNMRELGQEYFEFEKGKRKSIDTEKLAKEIQKKNVGVDENNALLIAEEVSNRVSKYDNAYFKAWNVLVALSIGIVAFLLPVWILKFKRKVSEMRKQEEVIMFQTLMMILMHTSGITLQKILEWMERFAYCFKDSISTCRVSIYSGEEKALETMKNQEQYIPFRSFVDSLKAIDSVGVEKAFSNVQSNYAYNVKKRENFITDSIEKKSTIGRFLCLATLAMTIIFYLVVPMAMYMLNLYSQYNQSLSI